jgi:hypothetical protein
MYTPLLPPQMVLYMRVVVFPLIKFAFAAAADFPVRTNVATGTQKK